MSEREREQRLRRDTQSIEDRESWRKRELEKARVGEREIAGKEGVVPKLVTWRWQSSISN